MAEDQIDIHLDSIEDSIASIAESQSALHHSLTKLKSSSKEINFLLRKILDLLPNPNQPFDEPEAIAAQVFDEMPKRVNTVTTEIGPSHEASYIEDKVSEENPDNVLGIASSEISSCILKGNDDLEGNAVGAEVFDEMLERMKDVVSGETIGVDDKKITQIVNSGSVKTVLEYSRFSQAFPQMSLENVYSKECVNMNKIDVNDPYRFRLLVMADDCIVVVENGNLIESSITLEQALKLCDKNLGVGVDGLSFAMLVINHSVLFPHNVFGMASSKKLSLILEDNDDLEGKAVMLWENELFNEMLKTTSGEMWMFRDNNEMELIDKIYYSGPIGEYTPRAPLIGFDPGGRYGDFSDFTLINSNTSRFLLYEFPTMDEYLCSPYLHPSPEFKLFDPGICLDSYDVILDLNKFRMSKILFMNARFPILWVRRTTHGFNKCMSFDPDIFKHFLDANRLIENPLIQDFVQNDTLFGTLWRKNEPFTTSYVDFIFLHLIPKELLLEIVRRAEPSFHYPSYKRGATRDKESTSCKGQEDSTYQYFVIMGWLAEPRELSKRFLHSRPCTFHMVKVLPYKPQAAEPDLKSNEGLTTINLTHSTSRAFFPRFSPNEKFLVPGKATMDFGAHRAIFSLQRIDWRTDRKLCSYVKIIDVITVVNFAEDDGGNVIVVRGSLIDVPQIKYDCFVDNATVALHWLNFSLSSDGPFQIHLTMKTLLEEYNIATHRAYYLVDKWFILREEMPLDATNWEDKDKMLFFSNSNLADKVLSDGNGNVMNDDRPLTRVKPVHTVSSRECHVITIPHKMQGICAVVHVSPSYSNLSIKGSYTLELVMEFCYEYWCLFLIP